MPVRVHIDHAAVTAALTGPGGPVTRLVEDTCRRVLNEAKRRCPVDEGRLRASLQSSVTVDGARVIGRVGTDLEYAAYVHFGTGLYGPKRQLIRPVTAKAMTWIPRTKGQGSKSGRKRKTKRETTRVFARYTRGMKPNPFLVEALAAVSPWPVEIKRG